MSYHTIAPIAGQEPGFHLYLNLGSLMNLPPDSTVPDCLRAVDWDTDHDDAVAAIAAAGYTGVQGAPPAAFRRAGLGVTGGGRITAVGELDEEAPRQQDAGFQGMTLHVGTGLETDDEVDALVEHVVATADRLRFPISIETHRATITQDIARTLRIVDRHPEVRFNGDFSHWYTGLEMRYGDFDAKLDALEPVFARVTHMHGRIGTPGCIQTPLDGYQDALYVRHFEQIWTRVFAAFKRHNPPEALLPFAPELLPPDIFYAPTDRDGTEFSDRWIDCRLMGAIARRCWDAA